MQVCTIFFFLLGRVERSRIMGTFEIKECNILCYTRCYTNIHQVGGCRCHLLLELLVLS